MGIKFFCPNGHKLNVKSFLAGKRGICPECNAKFIVPRESGGVAGMTPDGAESASAAEPKSASPTGYTIPVASTAPFVTPSHGAATGVPTAVPQNAPGPQVANFAAPASVAQPEIARVQPSALTAAQAGGTAPINSTHTGGSFTPTLAPSFPAGPAGSSHPNARVDPLTEAPQAMWYVRPRSGGQFGPAQGNIMRGWIAENRVAADSLVWREGWPDWRPASQVFPQLALPAGASPIVPSVMPSLPIAGMPLGGASPDYATSAINPPRQGRPVTRRKGSELTMLIVIVLLLLAIAMFGIFVLVIKGQNLWSDPEATASRPAAIVYPVDALLRRTT